MNVGNNEHSAEDERFLHMIDGHHKMGIEMCNDVIRNSSNSDVVDVANNIIRLLYFQMQEIQKMMH